MNVEKIRQKKVLRPPYGQRKLLAVEFGITERTLLRYLKGEVDRFSTAYQKQEHVRRVVMSRYGRRC